MAKNIKEIGKELLGKSLNSFHRKTGLTQLEKNNEMQDGILNGILSQVDDAYIEKTEQSNVIHLDGSGDGVVVVDSIEGNTMVNYNLENKIITRTSSEIGIQYRDFRVIGKPNTEYTAIINVTKNTTSGSNGFDWGIYIDGATRDDNNLCNGSTPFINVQRGKTGILMCKFTSRNDLGSNPYLVIGMHNDWQSSYEMEIKDIILLEGDYTNKEVNFFEGIQSSFEEHKTDEGKYEIEILSNNRNLLPKDSWMLKNATLLSETKDEIVTKGKDNVSGGIKFNLKNLKEGKYCFSISVKTHTQGDGSVRIYNRTKQKYINIRLFGFDTSFTYKSGFFNIPKDYENDEILIWLAKDSNYELETQFTFKKDFMLTKVNSEVALPYEEQKHNKIKLLINEPLRSVPNGVSDRLCVKSNKLVIERNCKSTTIDGSEGNYSPTSTYSSVYRYWCSTNKFLDIKDGRNDDKCICDNIVYNHTTYDSDRENINLMNTGVNIKVLKTKVDAYTSVNEYLKNNPIKAIYQLAEPYYEEVLNEYGEPILLEGYENGILFIDSTIVPSTTVRYTPKMESFNTLKEVSNNNIMLTNDINNTIVPYMMEVDLMIMEKEVAITSQKNIRKIGAEDMTSMQKRTQQMLERLIKGKTLNEQECKTRVTVYLNAGKITDEQAKELNFLIDEIYA